MSLSSVPTEPAADCSLCPRLVAFRTDNIAKYPDWFNGAVPSFSDKREQKIDLLIVGLAPGLQGANKTGRPFTGDWAGDLLYSTLLKFGFATGVYKANPNDGVKLQRTMITNAVRCVPPQNKPIGAEMKTCRQFLQARIASLKSLKVIICLGRIAHENTLSALDHKRSTHAFGHNTRHDLVVDGRDLVLIDSYHCSRYNTNTGRLTEAMFEDVFQQTKEILR